MAPSLIPLYQGITKRRPMVTVPRAAAVVDVPNHRELRAPIETEPRPGTSLQKTEKHVRFLNFSQRPNRMRSPRPANPAPLRHRSQIPIYQYNAQRATVNEQRATVKVKTTQIKDIRAVQNDVRMRFLMTQKKLIEKEIECQKIRAELELLQSNTGTVENEGHVLVKERELRMTEMQRGKRYMIQLKARKDMAARNNLRDFDELTVRV